MTQAFQSVHFQPGNTRVNSVLDTLQNRKNQNPNDRRNMCTVYRCPSYQARGLASIMLFPVYDRNPQTFVPNIFYAKPDDYRKATQRIWHTPDKASFINLPAVAAH
jgi:hypothetical protein